LLSERIILSPGIASVSNALFDILETQKTLESKARLTLFVDGTKPRLLADLLAADDLSGPPASAASATG